MRLCDRVHSDEQCSPCSKSPNGEKLPLVGSQSLCSYTYNIIHTCTLYMILHVVYIVNTYNNLYIYIYVNVGIITIMYDIYTCYPSVILIVDEGERETDRMIRMCTEGCVCLTKWLPTICIFVEIECLADGE